MRRYQKAILSLLMAACLLLPGVPAFADSPVGKTIESYVTEHEETTAGLAVEVFDARGEVYRNWFGYADKEHKLPVEEDTVFEWGSATKLLVWVSVMQLYEQGRLSLEQDISAYLPERFLTNLRYDTPVTMLNLMNHTAGFQETYADLFVKDASVVTTLEDALSAHKPAQIYEPGTVTAYSNWGVALAGYIVERISGMEFYEYVHQNIFEPLGMEHSALAANLGDNAWVREQRSRLQCYTADGDLIPDCFYYITLYPAGMCTSTLEDFAAFARALLQEESPLFERPETLELLFTPTNYYGDSQVPSNFHGFWCLPFENLTVGHGGNTAGCSSYLLLDRTAQTGVVVMTNQAQEEVYTQEMMPLIFGEYREADYFPDNEIPEGMFRSARTVRKGPFKLMSLSFASGDELVEGAWTTGEMNGTVKICQAYTDDLQVSMPVFVLELALIILWAVAIGLAVISLIAALLRRLLRRIRKKEKAVIPLGKWSMAVCILQILAAALLGVVVTMAMNYAVSSTYRWMLPAFGGIALVMAGLAVYGLVKIKSADTKWRKGYLLLLILSLAAAVANILYWNLFMVWAL